MDTLLACSSRIWISLYSFFYLSNPTGFTLTDKLWRLLQKDALLARSSRMHISSTCFTISEQVSDDVSTRQNTNLCINKYMSFTDLRATANYSAKFLMISSAIGTASSRYRRKSSSGQPETIPKAIGAKLC